MSPRHIIIKLLENTVKAKTKSKTQKMREKGHNRYKWEEGETP